MKKKLLTFLMLFLIFIPINLYANSQNDVFVVKINGEINNATVSYVEDSIKKAEEAKADAIIFEIDTYGGQVIAAEKIKNKIIDTDVRTIAYVNNKAESAGVLLTIACEKVYMSKTATIGSAETIPKTEKNISFWRSILRNTAEYRGRDEKIIEAMADSDVVIEGLSEKGKLINLTSSESLKYKISDGIADDYLQILEYENLNGRNIIEVEKTFEVKLISFVSNQFVSTFLLTIAMVALVFEILSPGFGIGGTISIISFGLFFLGNIMSGNSNVYSLFIFLLGLVLLFVEVIVPGFGLPGISGIIFVIVGIAMSMRTLEIAVASIAIAGVSSVIVGIILIKKGANSKFAKKITLFESMTAEKGYLSVDAPRIKVGDKGFTMTPMRPIGYIVIDNEKFEASSESGFIDKDEGVIVLKVDGSKIFIKRSE